MHIDWWTLALQTINALVLIWLLARFLFRPVAQLVAQRQQAAAALIDDAAALKSAAATEQQRVQADSARLAQQRSGLMQAAAADAAALKASMESDAHGEIERLRAAALVDIDNQRRAADRDNADRASRFALDIAARLLERLPPDMRVAGFIDGLAAGVAQLPDSTRRQLAASHDQLSVIAPRPLSSDELAACRAALGRALDCAPDHEPSLEVTVDASLIAGLELDAPHAVVRNSFRSDLDQLRTSLLAHDTDPA